jgi:transposase-like protein
MNANTIAKQYQLKQWAQMVNDCHESGLRVIEWCSKNGVSKCQYYYRLRKVREAMLFSNVRPEIVPVPQALMTKEVTTPIEQSCASGISITIGDTKIGVFSDASPQMLAMVLGVIRNAK